MKNKTKLDKLNFILLNIAENYNEYLKQTEIKLRYAKLNPFLSRELISDVIFSLIERCSDPKVENKFYKLTLNNKLFNYVIKSIDINCKHSTAPFLRNKIKEDNRITINESIFTSEISYATPRIWSALTPRQIKITKFIYKNNKIWKSLTKEKKIETIIFIEKLLTDKTKYKKIFGEYWKYYVTIFNEYINNKQITYKYLSEKYNIKWSQIFLNFKTIKSILIKEIENNLKNESI